MSVHTVGISDCFVTSDLKAVITTHALGSCIGVVIYDPLARVGGLLHYMLPDSSADPNKGQDRPFMYADTGIPMLFHAAYAKGALKSRMIVTVLGGAQVISASDTFNIGKRNHLAMRKIMWKAGVMVHAEDVGGTAPRTVRLEIETGRIMVSCGREQREIQHHGQQRSSHG